MRDHKGQAVVELAFVLPLLFVITFAIIDYGRALFTQNNLTNAARVAARTGAVTGSLEVSEQPLSTATGSAAAAAKRTLTNLDLSKVTFRLRSVDENGNDVPPSPGRIAQVSLGYPDFQMITPFRSMMSLLPGGGSGQPGSMTIVGRAAMRYE